MKILKNYISIVMAMIMTLTLPFSAFANTTAVQTREMISSMVNTLTINYKLEGDTIIETTSFIDVDNEYVEILRSVEKDGSGRLVYEKGNESIIIELLNQNYNVFIDLVNLPVTIQSRGSDIGSEVSGSQYKHLYISSDTATINNSTLSQIAQGGVGALASIIVGSINTPMSVAVSIATFLYTSILTASPSKVIIEQSLYEVRLSSDDAYYTHCYHEIISSYDSGGHLIDTTKMYKQVIGG